MHYVQSTIKHSWTLKEVKTVFTKKMMPGKNLKE